MASPDKSSGRIPEETISEIRDRTDIVEVVGRHVQLKRSGSNFKGLCPFHEEKTPSFNVNPARQFFHCFGCHESGDAIAFLMRLEGRTFTEVVEDLAQRAGVEIERKAWSPERARREAERRSERQRGLELNARVAALYRRCLLGDAGREARAYVERRQLGDEVSEAFQLGFAPASGDIVTRKLAQHGVDLDFAERIGLVVRRRRGDGYHDRFWNRLIFPLQGPGGEVIGFGGRMLGDGDGPKYINTPETSIYRKGEALYGLAQAAATIRQSGEALIVEGNIDVLQLHEKQLRNAVAPMGTALTPQQARLLRRFGERVVALLDGDDAGRAAARKAVPTLVEAGLEARVATLPAGTDPDSLLVEGGAEALNPILARAKPAIDHLVDELRGSMEDTVPARARLIERVAPVIRLLPSAVGRDIYVDRLALELGVERGVVAAAVGGRRSGPGGGRKILKSINKSDPETRASSVPRPAAADLELLKLLFQHPRQFARAERADLARLLTNDHVRATYSAAAEMQRDTGQVDLSQLLSSLSPEVRGAVAEVAFAKDFSSHGDPNLMLDDWIATRVKERLQKARGAVKERIVRAQKQGEVTRPWSERLRALDELMSRWNAAWARRQLDMELVPELIRVEQEIHETQ